MKLNRVNIIIECLYKNKMITKKCKLFYPEQYNYLSMNELLESMGVKLQICSKLNDTYGIVIDQNGDCRLSSNYTCNENERLFRIDKFDLDIFNIFKKNTLWFTFSSLMYKLKSYVFAGIILKTLVLMTLYFILSTSSSIIDDAFVIESKYVFEIYALMLLIGIILGFVILKCYHCLCAKMGKLALIENPVFIEDIKFSKNNLNDFENENIIVIFDYVISVFASVILFLVLYFYDIDLLKFALLIIGTSITFNIIFVLILEKLGFFGVIKNRNIVKFIVQKRENSFDNYNKYDNSDNYNFRKSILLINKYEQKEMILNTVLKLVCIMQVFALFVYTSYRVLNDSLSIGSLIFYIGLIIVLIMPFIKMVSDLPNCLMILTWLRDQKLVKEVCEKSDNKKGEKNIVIETPCIFVKNVYFSYEGEQIFSGINININKNEIIEIYGKPYIGKSTFAKLIMKKLKPDSGHILINDDEIDTMNNLDINEIIEYISFNQGFLNISIRDYLVANNQYSSKDIKYLLDKLEILNYLKRFPDYMNTVIKDVNELSNCEVSLLIISKAIMNNKRIIIIDQLLSVLNEVQIDAVFKLFKNLNSTIIILESSKLSHMSINNYYEINDKKLSKRGNKI